MKKILVVCFLLSHVLLQSRNYVSISVHPKTHLYIDYSVPLVLSFDKKNGKIKYIPRHFFRNYVSRINLKCKGARFNKLSQQLHLDLNYVDSTGYFIMNYNHPKNKNVKRSDTIRIARLIDVRNNGTHISYLKPSILKLTLVYQDSTRLNITSRNNHFFAEVLARHQIEINDYRYLYRNKQNVRLIGLRNFEENNPMDSVFINLKHKNGERRLSIPIKCNVNYKFTRFPKSIGELKTDKNIHVFIDNYKDYIYKEVI